MSGQGPDDRNAEAGFTLVEALIAIVILVFGLIAVTNLMLVAASSNSVANQGTAATVSASDRMEKLRNMSFAALAALGPTAGSLTANVGPTGPCQTVALPPATYNCTEDIPGVGLIQTRWLITAMPGTGRLIMIQVRSEGTGVLARARSRAEFQTFKACTDSTPVPGGAPGIACPIPP
jgi:type II secretory pathway pseudopilin PulG